jgi:predicted metal-dependent phosphoesterase TrpH
LEYLYRRGVTQAIRDGLALYRQYGVTYEEAGFPAMEETIRLVHKAGGRAVLAHPWATVPHPDEDAFFQNLHALLTVAWTRRVLLPAARAGAYKSATRPVPRSGFDRHGRVGLPWQLWTLPRGTDGCAH